MSIPLQKIVGGKYEIAHKIKEGGVGVIYKVRHRLLDEDMVIKVLRQQLAFDDEMVKRFQQEAKNAIRLHHPNIARIHDFAADPDEGIAFIVMEFIDGLSLEEVLQGSGPPSVALTIEISRQFLGALGYLHDHGIVHRDVAADNIMLSRDENGEPLVRLIDLGIAKSESAAGGLTSTGVYLGKFHYSSPEHFGTGTTDPKVERRSDLYSFGVLLYRLLTGKFPVRGDTFRSLAAGHLFNPPIPFAETDPQGRIPEGLRSVVFRSLAKELEDRTPSAEAFSLDLAEFAGEGPYSAELDAIFAAIEGRRPEKATPIEPGSTQQRIDDHFNAAEETAEGLVTQTRELQPKHGLPITRRIRTDTLVDKSQETGKVAWRIERAIDEARLDDAEEMLGKALHRYGEIEVLVALKERLASRRPAPEEPAAPGPEPAAAPDRKKTARAKVRLPPPPEVRLPPPPPERVEPRPPEPEPEPPPELEPEPEPAETAAARSATEIGLLIEQARYDDAEASLDELFRAHGPSSRHAELQHRLEAERRREAEARRREHMAEARRHRAAGDLNAAAAALRRLLQSEPRDRDARSELREVEADLRRQVEEEGRQAAIQRELAGIEQLLAARRFGTVKRRISRVRKRYGNAAALTEISTRCRQLEREQRVTRGKPLVSRLPELAAGVPTQVWVALGVALLLVSGIGIWLSLPDAPERPTPTARAAGQLVLKALPWAEITAIEGADGPRELPPEPFTPLALSLPPGDYILTLKNPSASGPRKLEVTIGVGTTTSETVDFAQLDAEEYFRRLGW